MHLVVLPLLYAFHGVFFFFLSTLFHFLFFYIPHQPEKSGFALGHEEKEIDFAFPSPEDVRGGLFCCRRDVYSRRKHTCFCRRSYDTFRSKMIRSREPNFELPQIPRHFILSWEGVYILLIVTGLLFHVLVFCSCEKKQAVNGNKFSELSLPAACSLGIADHFHR
jgi:hypothetical protein